MKRVLAYLRGSDMDSQRKIVEQYATDHGYNILHTYIETDKAERPERSAAIANFGADILVSSMDRFTRDISMLDELEEKCIRIIVCQSRPEEVPSLDFRFPVS